MTSEPILFYSTNRSVPKVDLKGALLQGQAADKGLFMPQTIPPLSPQDLAGLAGKSYPEIAWFVLRRFTAGVIDDAKLRALCEDAYDYDVPLERVEGRRYLMRLDRGPTASFKDFAARMMARWMSVLMEGGSGELVILTATSGDTGSAVAHAYHGVPRVQSVVLFPVAEVSDRQRQQMTTLGGNVTDLRRGRQVRRLPGDGQARLRRPGARRHPRLSSANSINIGRLLPQSVYYVYAYVRLADVGRRGAGRLLGALGQLRRHDGRGPRDAHGRCRSRGSSSPPTPTTRSRSSSPPGATKRSCPRASASPTP